MSCKTVLVVDDEPALASIYSRALKHLGYSTMTAANAEAALEFVRAGTTIDLILSDIVMPGMSGRELVWRVRELRPSLPIILASGYADEAGALQMLEDGNVEFIAKPIELERMMKIVRDRIGSAAEEEASDGIRNDG